MVIATAAVMLACVGASAEDGVPSAVRAAITQSFNGQPLSGIQTTPVPGLYEAVVDGKVVYVSSDGRYNLSGDLVDMRDLVNLTERKRSGVRAQALASLDKGLVIRFAPAKVKHEVYVFTDATCGFCRKLHQELDDFMANGVAVNYLLWPHGGEGSESYRKALDVWCAADRRSALTLAKNGGDLPKGSCTSTLEASIAAGRSMDVNGTPAIYSADGQALGGYQTAAQLLTRLRRPS